MKKNNIILQNKKSLFSLFLFLLLLPTFINAQDDIDVQVNHIIHHNNGAQTPGEIVLFFEDDVYPVEIEFFGSCEYKPPVILNNGYATGDIDCPGEHCFVVTKHPGSPTECTLRFCVRVNVCYETKKGNNTYYDCKLEGDVVQAGDFNTPPQSPLQPENNENYIKTNEPTIENKKLDKVIQEGSKIDYSKFLVKNIFPNPFDDKINVEINSEKEDQILITLVDNLSKVIVSQKKEIAAGKNTFNFDITSELPNGFYYIRLQSVNYPDNIVTKKLVRMK